MRKVLALALDSVPADLLFERFAGQLPNLEGLMNRGTYGVLESCDPPITIPAWMVMMTGRSPGRLGLYGFRHRKDNSYTEISLPTSLGRYFLGWPAKADRLTSSSSGLTAHSNRDLRSRLRPVSTQPVDGFLGSRVAVFQVELDGPSDLAT